VIALPQAVGAGLMSARMSNDTESPQKVVEAVGIEHRAIHLV
jgi:hypothetical protein